MTNVFMMLSGGVDSAVATARLIDAGYNVTGVFMKNWSYDRLSQPVAEKLAETCPTEEDALSAQEVAEHLGIPFKVVNFEKEYWENVVEPFFKQYAEGLTPNPDVWCNQYVKYGVFLDWSLANGADFVASGHYARIKRQNSNIEYRIPKSHSTIPLALLELRSIKKVSRDKQIKNSNNKNNKYTISDFGFGAWNLQTVSLLRGVDPAKDQSYFLAHVQPDRLKYALFPIGHLYKSQVRAEAIARGLPNASRKDSQGICFIGKIPIKEFLKERLPEKEGNVVLPDKTVIGQHKGAWFYTIGQRHIDFKQTKVPVLGTDPLPLYVVSKNVQENIVVVDYDRENKLDSLLWQNELKIHSLHWYTQPILNNLDIEIRYHQKPRSQGSIYIKGDSISVKLDQPVRAVTSGQTIVFSQGDLIVAAGIIK